MKARCTNKKNKQYKDYGGRGISYHPSWRSFEVFAKDVGEPPSDEHTLDRIDNSGNYEPGNVRWADRYTQARNRRQNLFVTINGETLCLRDWCKKYNITPAAVGLRVAKGLSIQDAITKPKMERFR